MYRQAIEVNPGISSRMYVKIGDVLSRQNRLVEAQSAYQKATIERNNNNVNQILAFLRQYLSGDGESFNIDITLK